MSGTELSRRTLLRLLGAGAVVGTGLSVAGCGSHESGGVPSNPGDVSGDITMWIYPIDPVSEQKWWGPQVAKFNKKYSKVKVKVVVQPWDNRDEQLTTAIAGGKGPDVVYIIPDQLPGYAEQKVLADVADVIKNDRDDFRPRALEAMTYKGRLYGVPILMGGKSAMIDKKILAACGVTREPSTWDDLLALGRTVKSKGYYATEYIAAPEQTLNLTYYPLLWQAGGEILDKSGAKAAFNSAAGLTALKFVKSLVDHGYVPKDPLTVNPGPDANNPIAQGKVAVVTDGTVSTDLPGVHMADWDVAPPLKKVVAADYGVVGGLSVLSQSKNPAAAKAWVKYLASPDHLKAFDKNRTYFSPRKSLGNLFEGDRILGQQEKYIDNAIPGLIHPKARQIMDLIKPEIQSCLLSKKSPEKALGDAEKAVNNLLGHS